VDEWSGQLWNPDFAKMAEPVGGRGIDTHEVAPVIRELDDMISRGTA
jgi:hypothetical protein